VEKAALEAKLEKAIDRMHREEKDQASGFR
jgi:hypothetical protein